MLKQFIQREPLLALPPHHTKACYFSSTCLGTVQGFNHQRSQFKEKSTVRPFVLLQLTLFDFTHPRGIFPLCKNCLSYYRRNFPMVLTILHTLMTHQPISLRSDLSFEIQTLFPPPPTPVVYGASQSEYFIGTCFMWNILLYFFRWYHIVINSGFELLDPVNEWAISQQRRS